MNDSITTTVVKPELNLGTTPTVIPISPEVTKTIDEALKPHDNDFNPDAWKQYTAEELYWWVHLLTKRATMRVVGEKREKDLHDAGNCLGMYKAALADLVPGGDVETHPNVISLTHNLRILKGA